MANKRHPLIVDLTFPVAIIGIIGNSLVIISILQRRRLLTSNYYFVVLHLAICDLIWLIQHSVQLMTKLLMTGVSSDETFCLFVKTGYVFAEAGAFLMLIIAFLRYRATAYPFKHPISKRRLKVSCTMAYLASFLFGYALFIPSCVGYDDYFVLVKIQHNVVALGCILVTTVNAAIYYKIGRVLYNQKNNFPISHEQKSSFYKQRYYRNRKIFYICLLTVIFFAIGNIAVAIAFFVQMSSYYSSSLFYDIAVLLRIFTTHAVNPIVYGLLDKKLLIFWRNCRKKRKNAMLEAPVERNW